MSSINDNLVLNTIFNPLLPTTNGETDDLTEDSETIDGPEDQLSKDIEIEAINAANDSDYDKALDLLTQAISIAPNRASSYNNRAQVYRVKGNTDLAFEDLNQAISLSGGKGLVGRQAYCQRGLIHLINNRQTEGIADMKLSAQLGNEFANALVVQLNPYAALCNKMLKDMIDKVRRGEDGEERDDI